MNARATLDVATARLAAAKQDIAAAKATLKANVSETNLGKIRQGMKAEVSEHR